MRGIRSRSAGVVAALAVLVMTSATVTAAAPANPRYHLTAALRPAGAPVASVARGHFAGTLGFDQPLPCSGCGSAWTSLGTLEWRLTLPALAGRTAAARIQVGRRDGGGATVGLLCGRCGSSAHGTFRGHLGDHSELLLALLHGDLDLTVTVAGTHEQLTGSIRATPLRRAGRG